MLIEYDSIFEIAHLTDYSIFQCNCSYQISL